MSVVRFLKHILIAYMVLAFSAWLLKRAAYVGAIVFVLWCGYRILVHRGVV